MSKVPAPPAVYDDFIGRFPKLGEAWHLIGQAGREGPLDDRQARVAKLALAVGAQREGSVRAGVRKGLAVGLGPEEFQQVLALAAGTIGMPSVVAAFTWIEDELKKQAGSSQ